MKRLLLWLSRKLRIVATPEESAYCAWADARLDQMADELYRAKHRA